MFHLSLNFLFLANEIIANVAEVLNLKSSAYQEVPKYFRNRAVDSVDYVDPIPPNYFKLGSLATVDEEKKVITIKGAENLPVGNIGDGVAVNVKAARVLRDLYGFESPGTALFYFPNWFSLVQSLFLSKVNCLFENKNLDSLELIVDFKYIYI